MKHYFLLIFTSIISLISSAQEERYRGIVVADSLKGFAINIINHTQQIGTTNDVGGYFEIPAKTGDSIVFSSVQYKVSTKVVSSEDLKNTINKVYLVPIINMLEEIQLRNVQLSGNIQKDVTTIETKPFVSNQSLGLPFKDIIQPTAAERRIYTASSTILDLLINTMSGKLKKLKKIKKIEEKKSVLDEARNSFSTLFFTEKIKIPEVYISDFLFYCYEDPKFENLIENSKKLLLLEFFQQKAIAYKKYKNLID